MAPCVRALCLTLMLCSMTQVRGQGVPESSSDLRFTASPDAIKTGLNPTTSLTLECFHNGTGNIKYIALGQKCGNATGQRMAYFKKNEASIQVIVDTLGENATITAALDVDEPFMRMVIPNTGASEACTYICHAKQQQTHMYAYVPVAESPTDLGEVVTELLAVKTAIAQLSAQLEALQETAGD